MIFWCTNDEIRFMVGLIIFRFHLVIFQKTQHRMELTLLTELLVKFHSDMNDLPNFSHYNL